MEKKKRNKEPDTYVLEKPVCYGDGSVYQKWSIKYLINCVGKNVYI